MMIMKGWAMKKVLILILLLNDLFCLEIKSTLRQFANYVASQNNIKILLSDEIKNNDFFLFTYDDNQRISIDMFADIVSTHNYKLFIRNGFYFVDSIKDENLSKNSFSSFQTKNNDDIHKNKFFRYIKFKNNIKNDISSLLANIDLNSTYFISDNSLSFYSDDKTYKDILNAVKNIDKPVKQVKFKLTITETNLNDIKSLGSDINSLLKIHNDDLKLYVNLLTMPYMEESNIIKNKRIGFYSVLNFLQNNGFVKIKSSPFLTAKNGSSVEFVSVENIPYKTSTSTYKNNGVNSQTSYDYKDVGLKIKITPIILNDSVDFDLELSVEDILSISDNLPTISKKYLKSSYNLKFGELLVLGGINKQNSFKSKSGIPILKDIWILKYLFSIEYDKTINSIFNLSIELLDD